MTLYIRRVLLQDNIIYERLELLRKNGFVEVVSSNDNTPPFVEQFIKKEGLEFIGVDGAGNEAEAFYYIK